MTTSGYTEPFTSFERKRLGQFFTGVRLARNLATLSRAPSANSILDPMAGSGDMFVACAETGGFACTDRCN